MQILILHGIISLQGTMAHNFNGSSSDEKIIYSIELLWATLKAIQKSEIKKESYTLITIAAAIFKGNGIQMLEVWIKFKANF